MRRHKCPENKVLLEYSAGELSEPAKESIAEHLSGCASCEAKVIDCQQNAIAATEPAATIDAIPSDCENAAVPSDEAAGATCSFAATIGPECRESQPAQIDQTIDSASSKVEISGDTVSSVELNSLLEAKRGQSPPFKAERMLAEGGMGTVLVGQDKALQRRVAVKVMKPKIAESPEHRARFLEEAQITGQLEHPNIVPIHDLGKDADGNLYFSMKLVKGQSLGQILAEMKKNPSTGRSLTELLNIVLKIADGLAFAHSKGVVHRDLKPDNIMVGDFGEVLIMDWGLAKLLGRKVVSEALAIPLVDASEDTSEDARVETIKSVRATDSIARTMDGTVQGTPAYMPPEQALGEIERIDQRSDIYSLGAILYEILTLERPVKGKTMLEVVSNAAEGNVISPDQRTPDRLIPPELSAVVMKAMQPAREARYQSVREFERDITLFLEGRAVSAKEDSLRESIVKFVRRNRAVSSAVAVASVIIVTLATYSYIRITRERDRAVDNEIAATENERKARRNEQRALGSELQARESEQVAINAQQQQWETALAASKQFALQAAEHAHVNRFEPARRRAKDAAIVAPEGPWQHFASGSIALAKADYPGAAERFRMAMSTRDGDQPEIRAALADVLARQGELEEAEAVLAELDEIDDWRVLLSAGRALYSAQNWDACQEPLARAIERMEAEKDRPQQSLVEAKQLLDAAPAHKACVGFYDEIRNLPFSQLQKRVVDKLEQVNGGRHAYVLTKDGEDGLTFEPNGRGAVPLKHLYPLRGLPITSIRAYGGLIWDLTPLGGMPLQDIVLSHNYGLRSIEPLRNMKELKSLNVSHTNVEDLSPIASMPLKELHIVNTLVNDISPLAGMSLEVLSLDRKVSDLSPLRGMPLRMLTASVGVVSDLSPLKGAPLRSLNIHGSSKVYDLEPLRGAPLEELLCDFTRVSDLSPLADIPLKLLDISQTSVTDLSPLKRCPLENLRAAHCGNLTVVPPLAGMPLKNLDLGGNGINDISGLSGLKLERLDLYETRTSDLAPLHGMTLEELNLNYSAVSDVSPLASMKLKKLRLDGCWIRDYSPLENLEIDAYGQLPFLLGKISLAEFKERMHEAVPGRYTEDDHSRHVVLFAAMKAYADSGPSAAIPILERYRQEWGDTQPPYAPQGFIANSLQRLRDELASQSDQPSEATSQ